MIEAGDNRPMLEGLRDGHGWDPVEEGGKLTGLTKGLANISLEPGGANRHQRGDLDIGHPSARPAGADSGRK